MDTTTPTLTMTPTPSSTPTVPTITTSSSITTSATTMTTTVTSPGQCQNGGTWDGGKCLCPEGFQGDFCEDPICQNGGTWDSGLCQCTKNFRGDRCQFIKDIVDISNEPVMMNATVEMKTKIVNRNLTDEFKNPSSDAYKDFEKMFQEKMLKIYGHIKDYQGVVIKNLSSGSIVVVYDALLKVNPSSRVNDTLKNISKNFVTAFQNYTDCDETCTGDKCSFCFNAAATEVLNYRPEPLEEGLCDTYVQEGFQTFYRPSLTDTGIVCVTPCDARHAHPLPCVHGSCSVSRAGPQCQCSDQLIFWYQDKACRSRVSKVGVAVGVPVAILVLVTTIFTVLLLRSRRQKEQYRDRLRSRSELYSSEDENWDASQGFAAGNPAATWEDMETSSTPYINLEMVDTSRMMHIRRPTVVPPVGPPESQRGQDTGTRRRAEGGHRDTRT
ncbi:mucin-3B-like [Cyanistes caeruleus]|uniref:Mucin-3B-like n=1 Tax=Cyanistes caeruleus TaxID=156563 RepID=A0A8C0U161_CYACU|nr:mucin-3B-like [Cyanistes caeruleus]